VNEFRRFIMWFGLILIVLLIALSIVGAFYGAEKASHFFNSLPLTVYWLALMLFLIAGIATFRRLIRVPSLLLIHLGCVFILIGAMWGSGAGHRLQKKLFGIDKTPFGYMMIYERMAEDSIVDENDNVLARLPFSIYLDDFRIVYYKSQSYLQVENKKGDRWQIPDEVGQEISLNESRIKILQIFRNFKIAITEGQKIVTDSAGPDTNPAIQINIEFPDGSSEQQYIFAKFPQNTYSDAGLKFNYISQLRTPVKDYFSDVTLLEGEKPITKKTIEVNHPLYYGGYHFYQHSYDSKKGQYTILKVHSDSGLNLVYAGYLMLCSGALWHLWFRHFLKFYKRSQNGN